MAESTDLMPLVYVLCGVMGLCVGSFLNVVIWRLPRRESLSHPGSHCPSCGQAIRPWDNIPVLSWLLLRGRCRDCHEPISLRYPLVELLTAGLFLGCAARFGAHWELLDYCVFSAVLVALSGIDLDHHLIPSRIVYPAAGASLALLALASLLDHRWLALRDGVIGGVGAFLVLFLIHVAQPRGMGFGDVRLSGLIGLNTAWLGLAHAAVAIGSGFFLGAVVGVLLLVVGKAGRKTRVAFGPFLAAGAMVAIYFGDPVVHAWLGPH